MNNNISTEEGQVSIVVSVLLLYALIEGFIFYLYALKRISILTFLMSTIVFLIIYIPRFMIIKSLKNKDIIKITDTSIIINNKPFLLNEIMDFRVDEKKSKVLFFFNNKMVVYKTATFHVKLKNTMISFTAIGTEKITLLKEFFIDICNNNKFTF